MLYDNALLARAYLHGWLVTGDDGYRRVAEDTLDYVLRDLALPDGGLASSQDADTDGVEGLTYTWTPEEVEAVLGEAHEEWLEPFEHGRSVVRGEVPADPRSQLLAARAERPQPLRDDKVLAGWNGLALAALAEGGVRLGRRDLTEAARGVAEFLLGPLSRPDGRLLRTPGIPAYLEDYANVADGLLELHAATGELRWLEEARRLAGLAVELFVDLDNGGFYVDAPDGSGLVARRKEFDDHPTPSGNSMLAHVLLRLARIYGDAELERHGVGIFRVARPLLERAPGAVGHLLCALQLHFSVPREVAVVGESEELRAAALEGFRPHTVYAFAPEPTDAVPLLAGRGLVDGRPAAYVCERFACRQPVTTANELRAALAGD
jgi:uncharacterized protein